jgi:NAD(P)-dependent dehydrogenase (short-subunit alcohol dehydrogenase family)
LLLDTIKKSNGRVINVSSLAHLLCFPSADFEDVKGPQEKHFDFYLYGKSKLANIIYSKQLAERGVLSYSLHPGSV